MNEQIKLNRLYKSLGYRFNDSALLTQALTHRSAKKNHNERLEYLGDSVLGMVIANELFHRFNDAPEGSLTRMRSTLVKGETLAGIAREFELSDYLILGAGETKSGGHQRDSILEDAVEAVIGAIFLDSDLETCQQLILAWYASRLDALDPNYHPKDPKTRLQELLQSRQIPLPEYSVVEVSGKDHAQTFVVECTIQHGDEVFIGKGTSRRKAEQQAAQLVWEKLTHE